VATVVLDRPDKRNALSLELLQALEEAMSGLERSSDVGVVLLTGSDPAFCAGLDLNELGDSGQNAKSLTIGRPWPQLSKPVIAAVNGPAVTGGLELVLHCDIVVASELASFADTHGRVGMLPGWGMSVLLPQAIGIRRAKEMALTGNYVAAEQAREWGLVNRVVPHESLLPVAESLARDMLTSTPACAAEILRLYDDNAEGSVADGRAREAERYQAWLTTGYDGDAIAARRTSIADHGRTQLA
jgi:enoyl-CoA hydratase